jgi:chorismate mutase
MSTSRTSTSVPVIPRSMRLCRQRMDALDRVLVSLLCRRSTLSVRIARLKRGVGLPLHAPGREGEILGKVKRAARDPLTPVALERIFRVILVEMRRTQRRGVSSGSAGAKLRRQARR